MFVISHSAINRSAASVATRVSITFISDTIARSVDSGSKVRLSCRQYAHLEGKWKISPSANTYTVARVAYIRARGPECRPLMISPYVLSGHSPRKELEKTMGMVNRAILVLRAIRVKITVVREPEIEIPEKLNSFSLNEIVCRWCEKKIRKKEFSLCLACNHIYSRKWWLDGISLVLTCRISCQKERNFRKYGIRCIYHVNFPFTDINI